MTIIVLQSVSLVLRRLRERLGSRHDGVHFTGSYQEMLDWVCAAKKPTGQTVVISGWHFVGEPVNGATLASDVKVLDPTAWFFIWSMGPWLQSSRFIDGFIPKEEDDTYAKALEFLSVVREVGSLAELHERLPWLTT